MLVKPDVKISSFDDTRWVVSTEADRHYVVNEQAASLCRILKESRAWDEAHRRFQRIQSAEVDRDDFQQAAQEKFGGLGLLSNDESAPKPPRKSYLRLRQQIIPPHLAGFLSRLLPGALFRRAVFWVLFTMLALSVGVAAVYVSSNVADFMWQANYALMPLLLIGAMLIHELGHVAACRARGVQHGGIGFGFYFVLPVMYADISNVWTLHKKHRLIANLGGIYAELLYAACLFALSFVAGSGATVAGSGATFALAASAVALSTVSQLNPFIRYDGYWVLSDALGVPNLMPKARAAARRSLLHTRDFLLGNTRFTLKGLEPKTALLLVYGLASASYIFFIMGLIAFAYTEPLLHFPATVASLFDRMLAGTFSITDLRSQYFLLLAFYLLAARLLFAYVLRILQRNPQAVSEAG